MNHQLSTLAYQPTSAETCPAETAAAVIGTAAIARHA
jgi:hypothetical protein